MKKTYDDDFKKQVAKASLESGATLKSVGEEYGVNPTLVRNWRIKFQDDMRASPNNTDGVTSADNVTAEGAQGMAVDECCEALENKLMQRGLFTQVVKNAGGNLNFVSILLEDEGGHEYANLEEDFIVVIKLYCEGGSDIEEDDVFDIIEPFLDENPQIFTEFGLDPDNNADFKLLIEEDDEDDVW
jgi:transposase-like protein